jgi:dolichyl-phosphate-mannose--protein O-mannosyl transferase
MSPLLARLNRPVVAILAVGAIAGLLRFTHLGYPQQRIFDEFYYSKSACIFLGYSNQRCDVNSRDERLWRDQENDTGAWVHPPLGKWMIALGELAVGTDSYGWRVSSAVTGTATVMLLAVIVQLLFGSPVWTFAGGLLLAVENLHFVQSRTAMLDVFVTFWIVLGFVLLLLDRRWIDRRTPAAPAVDDEEPAPQPTPEQLRALARREIGYGVGWLALAAAACVGSLFLASPGGRFLVFAVAALVGAIAMGRGIHAYVRPGAAWSRRTAGPPVPSPLWRPWRFAAGVALGAGLATKWSAFTALLAVVVLSFLWEVTRRRGLGVRRAVLDALPAEGFGLVMAFAVVPALVYLASYAGWFAHFGWSLGDWWRLQARIFDYHRNLSIIDEATGEPAHPYLSQAWRWLLLYRPVLYYADYGTGVRQVIYANGNPAIFWGSLLAIPYCAIAWARKRDWRAGFVVIAVACLYVPWLFVSRPQFLFYATPIAPFLVLACVYALRDLSEVRFEGLRSTEREPRVVRPYLPVAIGFVVVAVGLFVWFWPVLTGGPLGDADWARRAWFPSWT